MATRFSSNTSIRSSPTRRRDAITSTRFTHLQIPQKSQREKMELTRRHFIGTTATAVIVAGMKAQGKVIGANNRVRMCTIGFNGRGRSHLKEFLAQKDDVEYTALCDVDANVLAKGGKEVETAQGKAPKLYKDMREVFADKN